MENLAECFSIDVQLPEPPVFYAFQAAVEAIHSETYCLLIESRIKDTAQKDQLFNALQTIPSAAANAAVV